MRTISCGVLVTDGTQVLLGHATRSPRWDIPKGVVESGETHAEAAVRELREEMGLLVDRAALQPLGLRRYLPAKDLALFAWRPSPLPDPRGLLCASTFTTPRGEVLPEFDRFAIFPWEEALMRVGRNLARVLQEARREAKIATP